MPTYYVGAGGNDGNSGLTWALRKLTLNGVEDVPVVANDDVYVGPGVYREVLVVDVSGNAGNPITYIGDVTGENTDDVGGVVRITGSDNDTTTTRNYCIDADAKDYRTFRGFTMDMPASWTFDLTDGCENWIIEDCFFPGGSPSAVVRCYGDTQANITIRRCLFVGQYSFTYSIEFDSTNGIQDTGHLVENCVFIGGAGYSIEIDDIGGITVRNCMFLATTYGVRVTDAPPGGYTANVVENCIFTYCATAVRALNVGEIVEDYNTFHRNATDRTNVNVGGNSQTYPPLFVSPILFAGVSQVSGFKFPWWFGELSEWSQIAQITGSNEPTEDLLGLERPTTAAKNSWGALQFQDAERDTTTTRGASDASLMLADAGVVQFKIPVDGTQITIESYVYREANYAGVNPRMIVKQPGQADDTTTDVAAASQWNQLTTTLTPAALPPYVIVELKSLNTAVAGNYATYFEDLSVDASPDPGTFDEWVFDREPFDVISAVGGAAGVAAPICAPSVIAR